MLRKMLASFGALLGVVSGILSGSWFWNLSGFGVEIVSGETLRMVLLISQITGVWLLLQAWYFLYRDSLNDEQLLRIEREHTDHQATLLRELVQRVSPVVPNHPPTKEPPQAPDSKHKGRIEPPL